jgi:hypothetical protein
MAVVEVVLREAGVMIEAMHRGGTMEEVAVGVIGAVGVAETGEEILLHPAAAHGEIEGEFKGLRFIRCCRKKSGFLEHGVQVSCIPIPTLNWLICCHKP